MKMIEMIGGQLFKQAVIMEVNPHAFVRIAEKKNHLANLASEIWAMARLEINLGVKIVDREELIVNGMTGGYRYVTNSLSKVFHLPKGKEVVG